MSEAHNTILQKHGAKLHLHRCLPKRLRLFFRRSSPLMSFSGVVPKGSIGQVQGVDFVGKAKCFVN